MKKPSTIVIGTRTSHLALTQAQWVQKQILHQTKANVTLCEIQTQGDKDQNRPLYEMEGKDFFTKEIDHALLEEKTDLSVHSLKDQSLERPQAFAPPLITKRIFPHDIVFFHKQNTEKKISSHRPILLGTASPRRSTFIPSFLKNALPQRSSPSPLIQCLPLRGNLLTRLTRLFEPKENKPQLDAIVLALAGVERLALHPELQGLFQKIYQTCTWMILPISLLPTTPGQGALAIEYLAKKTTLGKQLAFLHHPPTEHAISKERAILAQAGGGCHQQLGATCIDHPLLGELLWIQKQEDGKTIHQTQWNTPSKPPTSILKKSSQKKEDLYWNGHQEQAHLFYSTPLPLPEPNTLPKHLFIAHTKALPSTWTPQTLHATLWTSGITTWFHLAKRGFWVQASTEGLGMFQIKPFCNSAFLKLPSFNQWSILSHSLADPLEAALVATYQLKPKESLETQKSIEKLKNSKFIYWSSPQQFSQFGHFAQKKAIHSSGPGKTALFLKQKGISAYMFPSLKEWLLWLL